MDILTFNYFSVDDEIQSNTVVGRLAYTVPGIPDIMGTMEAASTHYIANNDIELKFELKVANTAEATNSACPEG